MFYLELTEFHPLIKLDYFQVKHHLDKGSLHLYIVSTKDIEKNQEIILSSENKNGILPSLSIQDEIRQIRKVNGLMEERKNRKSVNVKRRLKRECVKKELCDSSSEDETPVSLRKTRSNANTEKTVSHDAKSEKVAFSDAKPTKSVNFELKDEKVLKETGPVDSPSLEEVKSEKVEVFEPKSDDEYSQPTVNDADVKTERKRSPKQSLPEVKPEKVLEELKIDIKEEAAVQVPGIDNPNYDKSGSSEDVFSPSANSSDLSGAPAKSPGKPVMGLPDQSGLIVGVNTINYDAGLKRKSKTREEKKMEMILKAIEAMERAEARKKSESGESVDRVPAKRRRSSSIKKDNADSNIEGSSGDEANAEHKERVKLAKGKRRRNISMRRRSRAKSGDSTSAMSADEGGTTPNLDSESTGTPGDHQPFKFPFKKHNHEFQNDR